ncbi:MAG: hypothetical protein V7711_19205 [Pseudomonadales bacterium]
MKKLGIIAAPGWFDPSLDEFMAWHGDVLQATQTILPAPGFDYSFDAIRHSRPALEQATGLLVEAGAEVIAQVGPAFAYLVGGSANGARELQQQLSEHCGVPVVLNGVAILDALEACGAKKIAAACPYYAPDWKLMLTEFLEAEGYIIDAFQTFVEQGIFPDQETVAARAYHFSDEEVIGSVRRTREAAPNADCLLISGSGIRTPHWRAQLEDSLKFPVIAADRALYLSTAQRLGLIE